MHSNEPTQYTYYASFNLEEIALKSNDFNKFMGSLILRKCKDGKMILETPEESTESLKKLLEEERRDQFNKSREQVIQELYEASKKLPNNKRDVHDIIGVKQEHTNERYIPSKYLGSSGLLNSNFCNIVPPVSLQSKGEKPTSIKELNEKIKEAKKSKNILVSDEFKKAVKEEIIKEKSKEYPSQRIREMVASKFLQQYKNKCDCWDYTSNYKAYLNDLCDNPKKWTIREHNEKYIEYCKSLDCIMRRNYFEEELGKLRKLTNEEYGNFLTKLESSQTPDEYDEMTQELNKLQLIEQSRILEQSKKEEPKNELPRDEKIPDESYRNSTVFRLLDIYKPHESDTYYNQYLKWFSETLYNNSANLNIKEYEKKYISVCNVLYKIRSIREYKLNIEKLDNITDEEKTNFIKLLDTFNNSDDTHINELHNEYNRLNLQSKMRSIKIN